MNTEDTRDGAGLRVKRKAQAMCQSPQEMREPGWEERHQLGGGEEAGSQMTGASEEPEFPIFSTQTSDLQAGEDRRNRGWYPHSSFFLLYLELWQ